MKNSKRWLAVLLSLLLVVALLPAHALADDGYVSGATLTFTNDGVSETVAGSGYAISGTTLTISAAGVYTVTGSSTEGNIVVKKGTTGVVLILQDLDLACSTTAPLACNKTTQTTLYISGAVTLTDREDPADESSTDAAVADAFEGAAIKVKSGATLTVEGDGILTADGSACKNGVKGGAESTITVDMDGKLVIRAANNGLAADGEVIVKRGALDITAGNEGIKAEPDEGDAASKGEITVSGGTLTINAQSDGMQATNLITITGGTFTINAQRDGIQSNGNLVISDGDLTIKTFGGYNASGFNEDTMSCKGLKASATDEDVENATNTITITGGTFRLNTRDDAVHSDGYIYVTGGSFDIYTGDDGMHADTELHIGAESGLARDPDVRVNASYEGLEAGNLFIYGGRAYVVASDDGINAAGGSGSDNFNPWNPGGPGGGGPGGGGQPGQPGSGGGDYSINISGGQVYVNCNGDGLDSNGTLNLTGGVIEVWSMSSGDNSPLDCDGTMTVKGATVLAAGARGVDGYPSPQGGQTYKNYTSLSVSANKIISIKNGSTTVFQTKAPKSAQFVFYSSPSMSSSWTCTAATGSVSCVSGNSWSHTWDAGVVTAAATTEAAGVLTYACTVCGARETQTIPMLATEAEPEPEPDEGFPVTFTTDAGSSIQVYETQDVTEHAILTVGQNSSGEDVSRNSATGEPDSSGDGQVNFVVIVADGYEIDGVSATEGTYKNIKLISGEGSTYVYRVTKITAATTVSVATKASGGEEPEPQPDEGFEVKLTAPENAEIRVYNTQILTGEADLTIAAGQTGTVYARDTQGKVDVSGSGQVNFVIVPAEGYAVDTVSATGSYKNLKGPDETGVENAWRITKITAGDVEVSVTVKAVSTDPTDPADPIDPADPTENPVTFTDVAAGAFYAKAVDWAISNNITKGTGGGKFSPNDTCTRGQVVTFLWRAKGSPEPTALQSVGDGALDVPFDDISSDAYYYKAVLWAVENGITSGLDRTHFGPNAGCTRGQVVTFLWRAEGKPSVGDGALDVPFTDVSKDAFYYKAMCWAVENKITTGTGKTTFAPGNTCTRGQIVTFLYRDLG